MAMILELEVPQEELTRIADFMRGLSEEVPPLDELGAAVLNAITSHVPPAGLWRCVVGRFVQYERLGERHYLTPEGEHVSHADGLINRDTMDRQWGTVVEDYEQPTDAYQIGVPL